MIDAPLITLRYDDATSGQAPAKPGMIALDALVDAEVPVAYNCRAGICQACRAKRVDGSEMLLCQTTVPEAGLVAEVDYSPGTITTASVTRRARLTSWQLVADDVVQIDLMLEFPIAFLPGQYATLLVPSLGGKQRLPRYFSCGGDPDDDRHVRFFIRDFDDGHVPRFLRRMEEETPLCKIVGPHGTFVLRETPKPKLFVAGGTGLTPFLSMLHRMRSIPGWSAKTTLVYGSSRSGSVYGLDEIEAAKALIPEFDAIICTDDGALDGAQKGSPISLIAEALASLEEGGDPAEVYMCGPPGLVAAAEATVAGDGGSARRIFSESFAHT